MNLRSDKKGCYGIVVLAAGSSKRMGSINKLLAVRAQGPQESILKTSTKQALSSLDNHLLLGFLSVVSGFASADVLAELDSLSVECVFNPNAESGMASSLQVGLEHLQMQANSMSRYLDFIIVCLGDMPDVKPETFNLLIEARLRDSARDFIVPVFNGIRGNPVLIGHTFFDALKMVTGDVGARKIMQKHPESTFELLVADPGVLKDYDRPTDFD